MALVEIFEPVLSGGIRNTNFFNGRLLTAEDLTDFQTANARQHQQLARALGDGVVYGLNVTVSSSSTSEVVLHVTQGLGLNRNYQAVALPTDIDLALVPAADTQNAEAGLFAVCQPPQNTLFTNPGLYILVATPASALSTESAPMLEVLDQGVASSCGSRWAVEGTRFRTVQLTLGTNPDPSSVAGQAAQLATQLNPMLDQLIGLSGAAATQLSAQIAPLMSKFRNLVAYFCFGSEKFATFPANPFGRTNGDSLFAEYGALDDLRDQNLLTNCDIPLALLYWTDTGLQFIDTWSVRRPVLPEGVSSAWAPVSSRRRMAEGLAMFLQFQGQINEMLKPGAIAAPLTSIVATDYFAYLPPVGLLPLTSVQALIGFDYSQFFSDVTHRCAQISDGLCTPVFIEGAKFEQLAYRSFLYPPIRLSDEEMVWLYWVRENMQPAAGQARPYVIFTNGHVPDQGLAQFNLNYWNYANFV
jgi:hypothetical protein